MKYHMKRFRSRSEFLTNHREYSGCSNVVISVNPEFVIEDHILN